MELYIDTTDNKKSIVRIGKTEVIKEYKDPRGQDVLALIEEVLKKANIDKSKLIKIKVNVGPGDFTSTRVGVAVANALGFSLKIPVNGKQPGVFVKPIYEKEPSITKSKKSQ